MPGQVSDGALALGSLRVSVRLYEHNLLDNDGEGWDG